MKASPFLFALLLVASLAPQAFSQAQTPAAPPSQQIVSSPADPKAELRALDARVHEKLQANKRTAADLVPEIAAFDALLAKYSGQKSDEIALIAYKRISLHAYVLRDIPTAKKLLAELLVDFSGTRVAAAAERDFDSMDLDLEALRVQEALVGKAAPELHFLWISQPGPQKLSDLKGKVVVLDFWATWCGPCVASFPEVRELAARYKDFPVVVLGVTSVQGAVYGLEAKPIKVEGAPEKEFALMANYAKAKDITWTIAVTQEEVYNKAYGVRGIPEMALIAPDGTVRGIGFEPSNLAEKIDALLKEFGLKAPATPGKS